MRLPGCLPACAPILRTPGARSPTGDHHEARLLQPFDHFGLVYGGGPAVIPARRPAFAFPETVVDVHPEGVRDDGAEGLGCGQGHGLEERGLGSVRRDACPAVLVG